MSSELAIVEAKEEIEKSGNLVELERALYEKEVEIVELKSELSVLKDVAPEVVEAKAPRVNPFMVNAQSMAADMMKVQKQEELDKLKRLLKLTPEQYAAVEAFFTEQAARETEMVNELFAGKSIDELQEDAKSMAAEVKYHSVSQLLEEILSSEQLTAYEAHEAKEKLELKEATAYRELSTLQRQFVLNEDQKDQVFAIYYEKDFALDSEEWESYDLDVTDPKFAIRYQQIENERLLEALSEVLSSEQLEVQRKKLEAEADMQRKALEMFSGGRGAVQ